MEGLNYKKLYKAYSSTGRKPAVEPKILFKVFTYAYMNNIYSSRKSETVCRKMLDQATGNQKTISLYRVDSLGAVKSDFAGLSLCAEQNPLANQEVTTKLTFRLSIHKWDRCMCERCRKVRTASFIRHDWDGCFCKKCGEEAPDEKHDWELVGQDSSKEESDEWYGGRTLFQHDIRDSY